MLSALPVASVVGTASAVRACGGAGATVSAVPVAFSVVGAVLVVKAVEVTATRHGRTCWSAPRMVPRPVCEVRAGRRRLSAGVGTVVMVSAIGTGVLLSAAGEVLAFIPNELGRALLHNERITH